MKILWLDLNASYSHSSLALPAIHAQVSEELGWEWCRVMATINSNEQEVVAEVVAERPDVVCATVWLFTHEVATRILSRVATILPKVIIFLGGPEFLGDNEGFLRRNRWATLLLRGEGEEAFGAWMSVCNDPERWHEVEGVCYIDDQGKYHDGGVALVNRFGELQPPYQSRFFPTEKPFVQLESSRGCFNTCAFCVSGEQSETQQLTLTQTREALDYFVQVGIKEVRVLDRTFNANPDRACELLSLFYSYHGQLKFHSEVHPALLTVEVREVLRALPQGLMHLEAGVQSLVPEVIAECRRKGSVERTLEGLQFLFSLQTMEIHTDLIAGLPHYHFHEVVQDVVRLIQMKSHEIQLESLKLLPGTRFRREADRLGILYADTPPYEVLATSALTFEEMRRSMKLSRLIDIFYNDKTWQELLQRIVVDASSLLRLLDYCCATPLLDQPMSKERRGLVLFAYIMDVCPEYLEQVVLAWLRSGLPLRSLPGSVVTTLTEVPSDCIEVIQGNVNECTRLYQLNVADVTLWMGYDRAISQSVPQWIGRKLVPIR